MKSHSCSTPASNRKLLLAALAAFSLAAALPVWQAVHAQEHARVLMSSEAAAQRHVDGLALEHRGDEKGAFVAFLDSAE